MDRRKFNKPIYLGLRFKKRSPGFTYLPILEKAIKNKLKGTELITTIIIQTDHLHRSSYYRVRRLANEIGARLIVPSYCIVDK